MCFFCVPFCKYLNVFPTIGFYFCSMAATVLHWALSTRRWKHIPSVLVIIKGTGRSWKIMANHTVLDDWNLVSITSERCKWLKTVASLFSNQSAGLEGNQWRQSKPTEMLILKQKHRRFLDVLDFDPTNYSNCWSKRDPSLLILMDDGDP